MNEEPYLREEARSEGHNSSKTQPGKGEMGWHATKRQIAYIRILVNQLGWGNDPDIGITWVLGERPEPGRFGQFQATRVIQELKQIRYRTEANKPTKKKPTRRNTQDRPRGESPISHKELEKPPWR